MGREREEGNGNKRTERVRTGEVGKEKGKTGTERKGVEEKERERRIREWNGREV